jgi:sortase A
MKVRLLGDNGRAARFRVALRGLEWLFLLLGLAAVDVYIWANTSTLLYQRYEDWAFDQELRGLAPSLQRFARDEIDSLFDKHRSPEIGALPTLARKNEPFSAAKSGDVKSPAQSAVIGRLNIPRLHLTAMVLEGADSRTLRRAVGHIPDTALPGRSGNVGLAGHRDTFFRELRNIRQNDAIELETENGIYRYGVENSWIAGPQDVGILASSDQETLTLVTCYPFYFVGSAPKRFIVRAGLLSTSPQRQTK